MARKSKSKEPQYIKATNKTLVFEQTFDAEDPLFSIAFNPESAQYVTGTATGQLSAFTYDAESQSYKEAWTTKRHKTSCRAVAYDEEGEYVYSIGSDNVLKKARAETGKVVAKLRDVMSETATTMIVNESYVGLGDESGSIKFFDKNTLKETHSFDNVHTDVVSSIVGLTYKNKYNFLTSGSATVAHIDIRKGVLKESEDQEDELLCGCLASDKRSAFGMTAGVVTVWDNNHIEDQMNRVRVCDGTVDAVIAGEEDDEIYAAGSDGLVRKINIAKAKIDNKHVYRHTKDDEVSMLEFDHEYRLVTANMDSLKLWRLADEVESESESEEEEEPEKREASDSDEEAEERPKKKAKKKKAKNATKQVEGISKFSDL
ncbi:hypothetical protein TRVA0_075S00364 [Trichomonascus vanleenenianus]|uniref:Jip5p n=1 Tax=Trichomonascus vanleenenianus TaxID=2268995 RepID=UPI003ECB4B03